MARKTIDCRSIPSEQNCDLTMVGSEEHILPSAVTHAVHQHGHEDTPELREELKGMLKDAEPGR